MNAMRTFLLMLVLTLIIVVIGVAVWGNAGASYGILLSIIMNVVSYWFADKAVLAMTGAQEVKSGEHPQLVRMVAQLAQNAQLPMPKVYILNTPEPNAFATGRDPEHGVVAVTTGIMHTLTDAELRGVIAHELAHIKHRDTLISAIAATMAGIITQLAYLLRFSSYTGSRGATRVNPLTAIVIIIIAPIAATLIRMGISRAREFAADAGGAQISGRPLDLANALAKIEQTSTNTLPNINPSTASLFIINPFSAQTIMSLFSTHPPTAERIKRLQEMAQSKHP